MNIENCTPGKKVKIKANGKRGYHYAWIDSRTSDMFTGAPLVIINCLHEEKIVSPDALIEIKRPKKR